MSVNSKGAVMGKVVGVAFCLATISLMAIGLSHAQPKINPGDAASGKIIPGDAKTQKVIPGDTKTQKVTPGNTKTQKVSPGEIKGIKP